MSIVRRLLQIGVVIFAVCASAGVAVDTDFILGMGKVGDRVIMLLDSDRVLSGEELELSSQAASEA